jgi:hypothetical protein
MASGLWGGGEGEAAFTSALSTWRSNARRRLANSCSELGEGLELISALLSAVEALLTVVGLDVVLRSARRCVSPK